MSNQNNTFDYNSIFDTTNDTETIVTKTLVVNYTEIGQREVELGNKFARREAAKQYYADKVAGIKSMENY